MDQFIQIYKKAFSDDYCNKVIEWFKGAEETGLTQQRQDYESNTSTLDKNDLSAQLTQFPLEHTDKELIKEFNNVFWGQCYKQYANQFDILKTLENHQSYAIKIQKTKPGQGYHIWHGEVQGKWSCNRLLTWTVYLNDEFEAGETEFLYQQYRYKPSKGDCIIFPAAYTHAHRGNPPIGGDKYIITGWVEF